MKKFFTLSLVLFIFSVNILNAAGSSVSANRNTAVRCLKLAENCLVAGDWENAIKQAELGLSYDNSISDLIYVMAAAQMNMGKSRADVIQTTLLAFEKDEWVSYTKNGARILLADLYCDTGKYEESLKILDSDPLLYSADAEFIRIKNYYRIGTMESINNARLKINSARRIFPNDVRFPEIFFMFETLFLNESEKNGLEYTIPEIVSNIAQSYIAKLPDYSGKNADLEIMACFFANEENKVRLINAIDAKNQTVNPLLPIAGLKIGLYSDAQAFDMFFKFCEDTISLNLLEKLVAAINDVDVLQQIIEKLVNFSGTIVIDENCDLQDELTIDYELGRPKYIKSDFNNDGVTDLYSSCDLGIPMFVFLNDTKTEIFYNEFPKVSKVSYMEDNYVFNFLFEDYSFSPFELTIDKVFDKLGIEFYVPEISHEVVIPSQNELLLSSASVELPVNERTDAYVKFTTNEGKIVFADYFENDKKYAVCDFTKGLPYYRYVDYDNDGYYETSEIYDFLSEDDEFDRAEERKLIESVFTKASGMENLYLQKVQIDRNANTIIEYSEQFIENGGKIILWDNDDNGIWDCQYIKYPQKNDEPLKEETIYFESNGIQNLLISTIDGTPVKMVSNGSEVMVYSGQNENLYWIENAGNFEQEKQILENKSSNAEQGKILLLQIGDERISVIKVGKNLFCRMIPASDIENEENEETGVSK